MNDQEISENDQTINIVKLIPKRKVPSPEQFYNEVSLYQTVNILPGIWKRAQAIVDFQGHFDCYCVECMQQSVFHSKFNNILTGTPPVIRLSLERGFTCLRKFTCTRDEKHQIVYAISVKNYSITKFGQLPSIADLTKPELKKYQPVLGDEKSRELIRGVGLISHGVGIGALVYIRRVFEGLVEKAHLLSTSDSSWDEAAYSISRMDEKIGLLKGHLPEFLVENKSMYGILSKGVHELSEDECLSAFPTVMLGIELILDEELEKKNRVEKIAHAKKSISSLAGQVKSIE